MDMKLCKILTVFVLLASVACRKDPGPGEKFSLGASDIVVGCEGGVEKVTVYSSEEWTAVASEPWVMVSPANGRGETKVKISVDTTLVKSIRTAEVCFSVDGSMMDKVLVSQTGYGNIISVDKPEVEIDYFSKSSARSFTTKVVSNLPFKVDVDGLDWVEVSDYETVYDAGSRPRSTAVKFTWSMNTEPEARQANIRFVPEDPSQTLEEPAILTIRQKAAPRIEDNRAGDSLAIVLIHNIIGTLSPDDFTENMMNWSDVELWDALDKDLPCKDAIGRVKAARFYMFSTEESLPQEVRYLKYVQTLDFYSNENNERKSIALGTEVCDLEYLKYLQIGAYGLVSIPDEFLKLGGHLVTLNLGSNVFADIPDILTPENFPALKALYFSTNRRISYLTDLRNMGDYKDRGTIGLYADVNSSDNFFKRLLRWDALEEIGLSYNFLEGNLPDYTVGEDGVEAWSREDVAPYKDTLDFLVDHRIPRILPNLKVFRINLNFFTGKIPDWLLYHPKLMEFHPDVLVFNQQENGRNTKGELVRFENEPANFEYYYEAFPKYRDKYTVKEVYDEE